MEFRNAVFVVTEERFCPIYNVGDEFNVQRDALTIPGTKPACLIMVRQIMRITEGHESLKRHTVFGSQNVKFECGGCSGLIRFEFKKAKAYSTTQMKLLSAARKNRENRELDEFTDMLRSFPVFSPLGDNDLYDLFTLLRFKQYGPDEIILRKGDPGTHLYIILTGKVEVVGDTGESISEMESGSVFGEMSLLTGAPVVTSVYSRSVTKLAALTSKDFKHVLHRYPVLHVFFYRLLIERAGKTGKRFSADIASGMAGDIAEVHVVELFQMINVSQKTGTVELKLPGGNATVVFNEGEVVFARYGSLTGKEALYKLLGVTKGQFTYLPGIPPDAEGYEVIGGFMGLVMEGMQLLDEEVGLPDGMHFPDTDTDQYF
jgi:CRP/FNR family transcriptional regulator, cyclic AMP receptor protein